MRTLHAVAIASVLTCMLALASCKHDYDALQHGNAAISGTSGGGTGGHGGGDGDGDGDGDSGSGGEGAAGSDAGDTGGMSGGEGGSSSIGACAPCDPPSSTAIDLGFELCCRGVGRTECGLALGSGTTCLPREASGEADSQCPAVGPAGMRHDGCCRPDGHCGATFDGLGLGCVAREDIPSVFAPLAEPIACQLPCEEDADCAGSDVETLCVPKRDQPSTRVCATTCKRDQDCPSGLICGLSPDAELDRTVAFCQEPIGDVVPTGFCSSPNQCANGVCLMPPSEARPICSQFCRAPGDCDPGLDRCVDSMIARPSKTGTPQMYSVCSR